jgi:hypothetical protein
MTHGDSSASALVFRPPVRPLHGALMWGGGLDVA